MTIEERTREAVDGYVGRMQQDLDAHAQDLTADLVRVIAAEHEAWRAERDRSVAEAHAEGARLLEQSFHAATAETTRGSRQSRVETLERLMSAVRRIPLSSTLPASAAG